MPISYKHKIYTTLGTPTDLSGDVVSATDSAGVPAKDYAVKGKTIVWNQLWDKSKYTATKTIAGVTFTNNGDGTIIANGTATADAIFAPIGLSNPTPIVSGHKFLFISCPSGGSLSTYYSDLKNVPGDESFYDVGMGVIMTAASTVISLRFNIRVVSGYTAKNLVFKPKLFDLTKMFGAGNEPSTPEEFRAMFPDDYYPYNAGELKTIVPTSIEASGVERFQLLDKSKFAFTGTYTKNGIDFINNGDGTYTITGTALQTTTAFIQNFTVSMPAGHVYYMCGIPESEGSANDMRFGAYSDSAGIFFVYNTIITASSTFNNVRIIVTTGRAVNDVLVKPQLFDLTQMFGAGNEPATPAEFWQRVPEKLYSHNPNDYKSANIPSSKYFPDGMKSAGSVYDEINFLSQKAIKRIGSVDLGTLNWTYNGTGNNRYFRTDDISDIKKVSTTSEIPGLLNVIYTAFNQVDWYLNKPCMFKIAGDTPAFCISDPNYTDAAAFKAAMSGVMLYYELATPVETEITPPLQALSTFKGFTSFSAPNSLMQNGPLSVTYYAEGGANPEKGWLTSYKRKLYMGRNIEWNQLVDKSKFRATITIGEVTFTNNRDGTITVNGTARPSDHIYYGLQNTIEIPVGHKILISGGVTGAGWSSYLLYDASDATYGIDSPGGGKIYTVRASSVKPFLFVAKGYTVSNITFKPQLFDLTQMFGAGNEPSTPEEFWTYFDHKLYPYNAGETQPLFKISRKSRWGSATPASLYVGEDIIIPQIVRN